MFRVSFALILASLVLACASAPRKGDPSEQADGGTDDAGTMDAGFVSAAGPLPAGLPQQLLVGVFEDLGQTWTRDSGVAFQSRYRYLVKGWTDNFGFGSPDGSWALQYMRESDAHGLVPFIQYYQVNSEPGGGEDAFFEKVQNATTMASYFRDFKLLMERAKEFGKPVVILLEADGYGFLQHQTNGNPDAPAAVASTGLPELKDLPDTVAGWGLAFLQLRQSVGATNALLGIHVSAWASKQDIAHFSVTDPLQPEVDAVYDFLAPLGLGANVTGQTYDLLVGDPLDRDADYYRLEKDEDRWWDMDDDAPIASKSFNRYAEWLRLWNVKSGKRWVLWQIPLGNRFHRNVTNDGSARAGYKDNRVEYFFETNSPAHLRRFAESGVVALLFGAGMDGMSSYRNDYDDQNRLYLKTRVDAFFRSGGLPIR